MGQLRPGLPAGDVLDRLGGGRQVQQPVRRRPGVLEFRSAGGNRVPVIAQLVHADEDMVRDVIHRFNEIGMACLDPRWAGGRPRHLSPVDEDFVVQTATTRPTRLGQPFTRWSIRKLLAYLRKVHGRVIRIGREALRCLPAPLFSWWWGWCAAVGSGGLRRPGPEPLQR